MRRQEVQPFRSTGLSTRRDLFGIAVIILAKLILPFGSFGISVCLLIHAKTRWNLTASGPRPNPQGSYHYGLVNTTRTIRLANSAPVINGKQRYAVNSVSFIPADTPLKVADFYKIPGVFFLGSIPDNPTFGGGYLQTSVMAANFRDYVEIVFENYENTMQSWHIDGYSFWTVGYTPFPSKTSSL